ncbi:MAG: hypothetical protein JRJ45_14725 [Deltaproteobacteria bacterium]|nr:hypothetical protein [Deltaproteobacteria bacterium]
MELAPRITHQETDADVAFNPLGGFHHAHRSQAEGFCYINDLVIAIKEALNHNVKISYVDIDAHHGNGVQEAFYHENRVQFISMHESGNFIHIAGLQKRQGMEMVKDIR